MSRLLCRLFGHRWTWGVGHPLPFAPLQPMQVCTRKGCPSRSDGWGSRDGGGR